IDPRIIVDKEALAFTHARFVVEVARIKQLQATAVQVDAIQVEIVRILSFLPAISGEVERLSVEADNVSRIVFARRDLVKEVAFHIVAIIMSPSIALRPVYKLAAAVHELRTPQV